jgi:hypothetical protein
MFIVGAFVSLAVDMGRVQLAKTQLAAAADAAARYGSLGASDGTAAAKAIAAAAQNTVDTTSLVLQSGDVQLITYSNGTYTIGGSSPNGVFVTAHRTASRGTGIPLTFSRVLGFSNCDLTAKSIAYCASGSPGYGVVGLSGAMLQNGTILVDSYKSASGAYSSATALTHGYVASNGGITMTGGVTIKTNIYMQAGQSLTANGSPNYGTRQTLSAPLSFSSVTSSPTGSTNLGNVNNGVTLGSGSSNTNYYCTGIVLNAGQTLNINGPTTLYINGNCTLNGTINVTGNAAANFAIRMMSSSGVNISTTSLYADIYAPQSPININSTANIYGRLIGGQLSVSNTTAIHYDESLPALPGATQGPSGGGSGAITMIK